MVRFRPRQTVPAATYNHLAANGADSLRQFASLAG